MTKPLHVLLNNNNPNPILSSFMERTGRHSFQGPKGEFDEATCPWASQLSDSFFLFVYEKEGNNLGVLTQKYGDHHRLIRYYSQQRDPVTPGYLSCLSAISTTAFFG